MTRKEREQALRREAIMEAARSIFERDGYFNTTMAQIAETAEFGVGTIYHFFPRKHVLFAEIIERLIEHFISEAKLAVSTHDTWQQQLASFVKYYLSWIENNSGFHRMIYEMFYSPIPEIKPHIYDLFKESNREIYQIVHGIFEQAHDSDAILDPEFSSLMILGMMHAIADHGYLGILQRSPKDYIPRILGVIGGYYREKQ